MTAPVQLEFFPVLLRRRVWRTLRDLAAFLMQRSPL